MTSDLREIAQTWDYLRPHGFFVAPWTFSILDIMEMGGQTRLRAELGSANGVENLVDLLLLSSRQSPAGQYHTSAHSFGTEEAAIPFLIGRSLAARQPLVGAVVSSSVACAAIAVCERISRACTEALVALDAGGSLAYQLRLAEECDLAMSGWEVYGVSDAAHLLGLREIAHVIAASPADQSGVASARAQLTVLGRAGQLSRDEIDAYSSDCEERLIGRFMGD